MRTVGIYGHSSNPTLLAIADAVASAAARAVFQLDTVFTPEQRQPFDAVVAFDGIFPTETIVDAYASPVKLPPPQIGEKHVQVFLVPLATTPGQLEASPGFRGLIAFLGTEPSRATAAEQSPLSLMSGTGASTPGAPAPSAPPPANESAATGEEKSSKRKS